MKIVSVTESDGKVTVVALFYNKNNTVTGKTRAEVSKSLMKLNNYFERDNEIMEGIEGCLIEQERDLTSAEPSGSIVR